MVPPSDALFPLKRPGRSVVSIIRHRPFQQALTHYTHMKRIIHPLLLLIARATEKEATQYIEYLKAENRILRSKLPKRVEMTAAEKATLISLGQKLGSAISNACSANALASRCSPLGRYADFFEPVISDTDIRA